MLYTREGDKGDTSAFGCDQRFLKSSELAEALGAVDEINSLLGVCKTKSGKIKIKISGKNLFLTKIVEEVQQHLFIIQASLAGADKKISKEKIEFLENIINKIEKYLPPVKSFFVPGGTELSALFDYARAVSRRTERKVVAFSGSGKDKIQPEILAYLNRLSSFLYAAARLANLSAGARETPPSY